MTELGPFRNFTASGQEFSLYTEFRMKTQKHLTDVGNVAAAQRFVEEV